MDMNYVYLIDMAGVIEVMKCHFHHSLLPPPEKKTKGRKFTKKYFMKTHLKMPFGGNTYIN